MKKVSPLVTGETFLMFLLKNPLKGFPVSHVRLLVPEQVVALLLFLLLLANVRSAEGFHVSAVEGKGFHVSAMDMVCKGFHVSAVRWQKVSTCLP